MAGSEALWERSPAARRWLTAAILTGILASLAWAAFLVGVAVVVADVLERGLALGPVSPVLLALGAIVVVRAALVTGADGAAQHAASLVKDAQRRWMATILRSRHPVATLDRRSGELVRLVGADIERVDGYVAGYLPARASAVAVPLLVAAIIGLLDPLTLPILLFTGPLLVITMALVGRTTEARTRRRERELAWLDGHFLDMVRGLPTLRLFGRSKEQITTIDTVARRLASSSLDVLRTAFQTSLVLEWGATAATALVAIAVSVRLMAGEVTFERALAVLLLTPECFAPVRRLASQYHVGSAGRIAIESLHRGVAETTVVATGTDDAVGARVARTSAPRIGIRGLTVTYPDRDGPSLDGVSLDLEPNRLTVLDGPTGAGKSTVAAVLLRFVEPSAGVVRVDGLDLAGLDPVAWRRSIAWLPQTPHLFDGSVADNIRLGAPDASDDAIRAAVRAAGVEALIAALPHGLDTRVGEGGARLSGGEVARIGLARALVRDAPLLIADEPTANLDAASAGVVRATLLAARRTATVLVISHDPGLAAIADHRVSLQGGRTRRSEVRSIGRTSPG